MINRILSRLGWILVPLPPSAHSLEEIANVAECHHPARGGHTVRWVRSVARETERHVGRYSR